MSAANPDYAMLGNHSRLIKFQRSDRDLDQELTCADFYSDIEGAFSQFASVTVNNQHRRVEVEDPENPGELDLDYSILTNPEDHPLVRTRRQYVNDFIEFLQFRFSEPEPEEETN